MHRVLPYKTRTRAAAALIGAGLSLAAASARSAPAAPAAYIEPCQAGTPDHDKAKAALAAFEKRLFAGDPGQPQPASPAPKPVAEELTALNKAFEQLRDMRCFALSRESHHVFDADSVLALRTWWREGGGEWLAAYLTLAGKTPAETYIVLPPEMPLEPELGSRSGQIPPELRCDDTPGCGQPAGSWERRARETLELYRSAHGDDSDADAPDGRRCAAAAERAKEPERYRAWRSCMEESRKRVGYALPIGRYRPITRGWLVVRGRRGHYTFCNEVRAYDLATGAAYAAKDCGGLRLQDDGRVDGKRTRDGLLSQDERGRLSVEALREAAWMLVLAPETRKRRSESVLVRLPASLRPRLPARGSETISGFSDSVGFSSSESILDFSIQDQGRVITRGTLTWPSSAQLNDRYAASLLDVAEHGLAPGCPPAPLPAGLQLILPPEPPEPKRTGEKAYVTPGKLPPERDHSKDPDPLGDRLRRASQASCP